MFRPSIVGAAALLLAATLVPAAPAAAATAAPTFVGHTAYTDHVDLTWDATPGATRYEVLRRRGGDAQEIAVGTTSATRLTDPNVENVAQYFYRVRPVGGTAASPEIEVFTGAPTVSTMLAPAQSETGQRVQLSMRYRMLDNSNPGIDGKVRFYVDGVWVAGGPGYGRGLEAQTQLTSGRLWAQFRGDPNRGLGSSSSAAITHTVVPPAVTPATFARPVTYQYGVASDPRSVAVADVTGDGRLDTLMTTTSFLDDDPGQDYAVWVFAQQPNGTLAAPVLFPTGFTWGDMRLATGDVDGDGDADVVVSSGHAAALFTQAGGTLTGPAVIAVDGTGYAYGKSDPTLADLDADGRDDLVYSTDTGIFVLRSEPAGFGAPVRIATDRHRVVEVGDLTGDGLPDIATLDEGMTAYVYGQTATGDFPLAWQQQVPAGFSERLNVLAVGDLTGDGLADLLVTAGGNVPDTQLQVYPQTAGGGLADAPITVATGWAPETVRLADINGDGLLDVVIGNSGGGSFTTHHQRPDGLLGAGREWPAAGAHSYDARGAAVGDVTGDGLPDVVLANHNRGLYVAAQTAQ